jgi:hypothetical protein
VARTYTHHKPIDRVKKFLTIVYTSLVDHDSILSYAPIALVTICMFFGASWTVFYIANDPARYQCYALTFWLGSSAIHLLPAAQCAFLHIQGTQPPFHMLPREYPPLTLLPFSLALLSPLPYYQVAFAVLMSLVAMLVYWLLLTYGPRGSTLIFALYLFIGALATAQIRYDLIPATLTLLCLIAAERKHWTSAYVALAFGVLMKIYPLLLLPALFIAEQYAETGKLFITKPPILFQRGQWLRSCIRGIARWRWKNCIIFFAIIVTVTASFAVLDFQGAVVSQLQYFVQRPIQIESLDSTILWLAQGLGYPLHFAYTFGSINSYSLLSSAVSSLSTICFLLGCLYTTWLQWHGRINLAQSFIALLLLFIVTGKVFSPQYLLWLIPLLAYTAAFDGVWALLWGTLSALTMFMFVFYYSRIGLQQGNMQALVESLHGFFELLAVRNFLLVLLTLSYIYNWFQIRQRKPRPELA